ncbi:MAG: S-layer homology domain-containing protein [Prochlorotrichaceae cyanobacterium]
MHLINSVLVYHVSLVSPAAELSLFGSDSDSLKSSVPPLFLASTALGQPQTIPPLLFAFLDVPQGYWARDFIAPLVNRGILQGFPDGSFRPNQTMTRAEFAVLLSQFPWSDWMTPSKPIAGTQFADVSHGHWAATAIARVTQWGLMQGDPDGRFRPQQSISRLEALLTLSKGIRKAPLDLAVLSAYHDRFVIPPQAQEAIALAAQHQLVVTYPDPHFLNPKRLATRAEICAFLHQFLTYRGEIAPIQSPYISIVHSP